jgi:hypothetical protein
MLALLGGLVRQGIACTAPIDMGAHKILNVSNGSGSQDAAAFNQAGSASSIGDQSVDATLSTVITGAGETVISFDGAHVVTGGGVSHSTTVNPSRFTAGATGRYGLGIVCVSHLNAVVLLQYRVNGGSSKFLSAGPANYIANGYIELELTSGDYVEFTVELSGADAGTIAFVRRVA